MVVFLTCVIIFLSTFTPVKGSAANFSHNESTKTPPASMTSFDPAHESTEFFKNKIIALAKESIAYNNKLKEKDVILDLLNEVQQTSCYIETGSDDFRAKFVHAQAAFEHAMACCQTLGDITDLVGVIHTPTPTTPLCVQPEGPISKGILDETIRWDIDKLLTIHSRAQIIREYLHKGGKLYVVYPQGGFQKRTPQQQGSYKDALRQFETNLFDTVLSSKFIHPDMIGATYLFKNRQNQIFAFSIKARQANDVQKKSEWGIWFGAIDSPEVATRVDTVFNYLKANGGPDFREAL